MDIYRRSKKSFNTILTVLSLHSQRYSKPALRPDSHMDIYRRSKKSFNTILTVLSLHSQRYSKPALRPDSHMDIYRRSKKSFNNKQMSALARLYKWRDDLARAEDESTQ